MAIGVLRIRRALGIFQCQPDERRAQDIKGGLEAVCDQGIRVPKPPCAHFYQGKQQIDKHTREQNGSSLGSSLGEGGH